MSDIIDLTNETWDAFVTKGNFRTVIEFYTPWCRESQMMAEVMDKMRSEFPSILFCRSNMDKFYMDAMRLKVEGVPSIILLIPISMMLVPNGGPATQLVVEHIKGFVSADVLREKLKAFMAWENA